MQAFSVEIADGLCEESLVQVLLCVCVPSPEALHGERSKRMNSVLRMTVAILALGAMAPHAPTVAAQKDPLQPACVLSVPASWGEYKGASRDFGLAFQDNSGTLRFTRDLACEAPNVQRWAPAYLEVRRR